MLDPGIFVDDVNRFKRATLLLAATKGQETVASLLLSFEIKIDRADNHGKTPLYRAAERGHVTVVLSLLQLHANPSCEDIEAMMEQTHEIRTKSGLVSPC